METQRISITLEEYLELINDRERLFYFNDSGELSVNGGMKSADKDIGLTKMSDLKKDKRIEVNKPITPEIPDNWKPTIEQVETIVKFLRDACTMCYNKDDKFCDKYSNYNKFRIKQQYFGKIREKLEGK